MRDDIKLMCL